MMEEIKLSAAEDAALDRVNDIVGTRKWTVTESEKNGLAAVEKLRASREAKKRAAYEKLKASRKTKNSA